VSLLNTNGLKISKIAKLTDADISAAVLQLSEGKDSKLESQIENLKLIMVDMNEAKFEKLFSHLVLQMGFEETIMKVFVPFFKRLNFLWQTNSVSVAHINFITSLYKQKLYVAIDGLAPSERVSSKKFLMFLPKTERLDNGLLFCNFMARKRGFQTLYLGDSFPAEELADILEKNPESHLVSVATLAQTDLTKYYAKVLSFCSENQKLLLTGAQTGTVKITDPRLTVMQDYVEFQDFLDQL
jgi:methanogenic corrinoid protein MtbC1